MKPFLPLYCLLTTLRASAQQPHALAELRGSTKQEVVVPGKVYTYVEQMPELLGGGGTAAIAAEIQRHIGYPAVIRTDAAMRYSGIVFTFVVSPTGNVRDAAMLVSSNNQEVDRAILAGVYALPTLKPGRQHGQPVPVRLTIPISCIKVQ